MAAKETKEYSDLAGHQWNSLYKWIGLDWYMYMTVDKGCFPFSKNFVWNFRNSMCQMDHLHSYCTVPTQATAHLFIVHSNCQQDTEDHYWGQQFCQNERDILVWPAKIPRLVKLDHLQSWPQIFWSEWTDGSFLAFYFYKTTFAEFYGKWN